MVAAVSETNSNQSRPPLLPSEKDNGISVSTNGNSSNKSRPKSRQVSSRYLSPSPSTSTSSSSSNLDSNVNLNSNSRRFASPAVKRSVSADRRRPTRPDLSLKSSNAASGEVSAATKLLVTSTRSLSVSFQGQAFSLPVSKTKATPPSPNLSSARKGGTPERKRLGTPTRGKVDSGVSDHVENTKPSDQHRWPGRTRQVNQTVLSKSLSLDCGVEKGNLMGSGNVIMALHQSMNLDGRRSSIDGSRLSLDQGNLVNDSSMVTNDLTSDTDSVSSGSTSGIQEGFGLSRSRSGAKGMVASSKFWQETNSRMRRLQDPGPPFSTSPGSKLVTPSKSALAKKFTTDSPLSSPRTMASPNRMRPASPSKFMTSSGVFSPSRGMISPRRNSVSGTISTSFNETPSVLSFAVDVRRGKVGENRIVDAHLLRLFYNRQLQWRFVNARTEDTLLKQSHSSEKNLWNAWITISDLRDSVTKKRHRLQLLRQKLKLASILKEQIAFLEDWASLDKDHSVSLLGAIEALKASTLRLPVGGAIADLQSMKDVITSALEVMQAMCSSIYSLCVKEYFSKWGDSDEVDLKHELERLIILTASRCLLGEEVRNKLFDDVSALFHDLDNGMQPISVIFPYLPIPCHRTHDRARKKLAHILRTIINSRKQSGKSENDMLQCFIDSKYKNGRPTTESEVTGLLIAALFAGQHTSTSSITSTWTRPYLLCNPKYMAAALDEQKNIMKDHGKQIDHDILSEMNVLYRCIKEALRLHPPLIMLLRSSHCDFTVTTKEGKDYDIPKGHIVATSPAFANRLPHVFKDPDTYDLDRFSPGREEDKVLGAFSYISFGGGRHGCLGEPFAYLQIKAIWSHLLRNFELELVSPFPETDWNAMVVGVKGKVMVRYKRKVLPVN